METPCLHSCTATEQTRPLQLAAWCVIATWVQQWRPTVDEYVRNAPTPSGTPPVGAVFGGFCEAGWHGRRYRSAVCDCYSTLGSATVLMRLRVLASTRCTALCTVSRMSSLVRECDIFNYRRWYKEP
jgi:hypothetical protein